VLEAPSFFGDFRAVVAVAQRQLAELAEAGLPCRGFAHLSPDFGHVCAELALRSAQWLAVKYSRAFGLARVRVL
jgi:hypothetical protein